MKLWAIYPQLRLVMKKTVRHTAHTQERDGGAAHPPPCHAVSDT
jgi:hypothetical protein